LKEGRPEGFVGKTWSFLPTFETVSTEMKRTQFFWSNNATNSIFSLAMLFRDHRQDQFERSLNNV